MDQNQSQTKLPDVVQEVVIGAPVNKVWEAVSTSEGIAAWFMPNDFQAELGNVFHVDAGPFGKSRCEVVELDPPKRLAFKWDKDWTVTFQLEEVEGGTKFTLTHGGWDEDTATAFGEKHAIVRERMAGGWVGIVKKLVEYVQG
ncbi:SRPBCC domain-containing protein [Paenibacillus sp. LHD-117]|uniref:SRPBCC family protein n=1 Tax=Paenibacillus sp. LHD-117 TaxID=3071412 RepID=UPI0027E153C4|nr:SRPBCC domain-containing protein [Paenibacillus sp. LHD-117]MDQ6418759.1 SRPBCC domain-containing protein [Paenibacillus sp. LHD-117]